MGGKEDTKTGTNKGALESEDLPTCSHSFQQTTVSSASSSSGDFFSSTERSSTSALGERFCARLHIYSQ